MDEIQNSTPTTAAVDEEDWSDITLDGLTDDDAADTGEEGAAAEEPTADQPTEAEAEQKPETESEPQAEQKADQLFDLKHLDETRTVNREEVIALAQKGLDYDRIRDKYDAAKNSIEWYAANAESVRWLEEIAKEQNMSFGQMVDATRAQIMANKTGQPLSVCQGIVANERKAAELEAQRKTLESKNSAEAEQAAAKARMQADIKAFQAAYPEQAKTPEKLPKEVWDAVHNGDTLLNAYRAYENKQLKEQLAQKAAAEERRAQEEKNRARSTGSQSTAGSGSGMDAFDAAWYNGD